MTYKWNECLQFLCLTGALVLCYALGPEQILGCLVIWGALDYLSQGVKAGYEIYKNQKESRACLADQALNNGVVPHPGHGGSCQPITGAGQPEAPPAGAPGAAGAAKIATKQRAAEKTAGKK